MSTLLDASIPIIKLSESSPEKLGASEAIKNLGFIALKSPDEPTSSQISELFRISQEFFENESADEKERCAITVENKGWVKMRQERWAYYVHTLSAIICMRATHS